MPNYTMTLEDIRAKSPCRAGWKKLLAHMYISNDTPADTYARIQVTVDDVLNSNGLMDAIWVLQCLDWKSTLPLQELCFDFLAINKDVVSEDDFALASILCFPENYSVEAVREARLKAVGKSAFIADLVTSLPWRLIHKDPREHKRNLARNKLRTYWKILAVMDDAVSFSSATLAWHTDLAMVATLICNQYEETTPTSGPNVVPRNVLEVFKKWLEKPLEVI